MDSLLCGVRNTVVNIHIPAYTNLWLGVYTYHVHGSTFDAWPYHSMCRGKVCPARTLQEIDNLKE